MYTPAIEALQAAQFVTIIQAENPDGDSLGSSLGLEEILSDAGKHVTMFCPVDIPKYLRYARGWDRVQQEFPGKCDVAIIVDTASKTLLEKALTPPVLSKLGHIPVVVLDHHVTAGDLPFNTITVSEPSMVATGELVLEFSETAGWKVSAMAAEQLAIAVLSDSLGLTTEATTAGSFHALGRLVEHGARPSEIENRRREFMKKAPEILEYKGKLLQRIEYYLDGQLAVVHIPWDEIESYSDKYNPTMLVLDEMRLVEGVRLAVGLKTYPDGKVTGKIRANPDAKIAETVAGYFGGGGHPYAAGFRIYDTLENTRHELVTATHTALQELQTRQEAST